MVPAQHFSVTDVKNLNTGQILVLCKGDNVLILLVAHDNFLFFHNMLDAVNLVSQLSGQLVIHFLGSLAHFFLKS